MIANSKRAKKSIEFVSSATTEEQMSASSLCWQLKPPEKNIMSTSTVNIIIPLTLEMVCNLINYINNV
jgi:hypothetical protein